MNQRSDKHGATPRTDALVIHYWGSLKPFADHPVAAFARELERELAEANVELMRYRDEEADRDYRSEQRTHSSTPRITRCTEGRADCPGDPCKYPNDTGTRCHDEPPFPNCRYRICDLPGQCTGEGRCHHPATRERADGLDSLNGLLDAVSAHSANTRRCPMQGGPTIPWALAEAIWQGYAKCGGDDQPLEQVAKRGGFGWSEVEYIWKNPEARRAIEAHLRASDDRTKT